MSQVAYDTGTYPSFSEYKVTRSIVPGWDASPLQVKITSQH